MQHHPAIVTVGDPAVQAPTRTTALGKSGTLDSVLIGRLRRVQAAAIDASRAARKRDSP